MWPKVLALLVLGTTFSCISYKRPEGAWAKPLALSADPTLLAKAPVEVLCAVPRKEPGNAATRLEFTESSICEDIKLVLHHRGFKVRNLELEEQEDPGTNEEETSQQEANKEETQDPENQDPENQDIPQGNPVDQAAEENPPRESFTLIYIFNKAKRDNCGWTLVTAILTFSLFPCLEDVQSSGEIRILNSQGLVQARYPLKLVVRNIYGIGALYYHGLEYLRTDKRENYHRDLQRRLVLYVGDIAISYASRENNLKNLPSTVYNLGPWGG
jgi:hypothetical protein